MTSCRADADPSRFTAAHSAAGVTDDPGPQSNTQQRLVPRPSAPATGQLFVNRHIGPLGWSAGMRVERPAKGDALLLLRSMDSLKMEETAGLPYDL